MWRNVEKCELDSTRTAPCWLKALGSPRAFCRACRANIRLSVSSSLWQIRRQHHSQMFIDPLILTDRLCVHLPDLFWRRCRSLIWNTFICWFALWLDTVPLLGVITDFSEARWWRTGKWSLLLRSGFSANWCGGDLFVLFWWLFDSLRIIWWTWRRYGVVWCWWLWGTFLHHSVCRWWLRCFVWWHCVYSCRLAGTWVWNGSW